MCRNCSTCGGAVSDRYHRVMADREGRVECPGCRPVSATASLRGVPAR